MSYNTSWTPLDQDPQALFSERCWMHSVIIAAVAYGVTIPLYSLASYHLIQGKNRVECKKRLPLLIVITISFLLGTISMITLAGYLQMMFIDYRNYPGGPNAFQRITSRIPIKYVNVVVAILSNWLSDALVVWRFKIIYQACRAPMWVVMLFPCLLLAGTIVSGTIFLVHFSTTTVYSRLLATLSISYTTLSLGLNIILTLAIVIRLLTFRHRIVSLMGPKYGTRYTSASAVVIESASLYSAVNTAYIISLVTGNAISQVFLQASIQIQTVATLLIVFRVALGKGWAQDTAICTGPGSDPSHSEKLQIVFPPAFATVDSLTSEGIKSGDEESFKAASPCSDDGSVIVLPRGVSA